MSRSIPVTVHLDGISYQGTYRLSGGMITVASEYGTDTLQVGGRHPDALAQIILTELVRKQKR
jgi:hypothetical protein